MFVVLCMEIHRWPGLLLAAVVSLAGCATRAPLVLVPADAVGAATTQAGVGQGALVGAGPGALVVYSATFAPTLEEGEYPAHTDYTIATTADRVLRHVTNQTGSFDKHPATISLESGEYHVRAQYAGGGFVTIPVVIEPGKTTTLDLDGAGKPRETSDVLEPIRLPDGKEIGWETTQK